MTDQEKIRKVAQIVGGKVREQYSGRGMFGEECMGIVCDYSSDCLEVAGEMGLRGAKIDNMGNQVIVYWPKVKLEES